MAAGLASAQPPQRITPNFKDADITQVAEAVAAATGKNFIIDPRVRAQVTMLSSTAMTPPAFYEAFLSILQVYGFIAVPAGDVVKILPDANARQFPAVDLPDRVSTTSDEMVTQVLDVHNVSAAQLVPMLRPMIAQYGHLAAYPASNILIISDHASNVNRMMRIIQRIDQVMNQDVEIVPLQNASAAEVVRVVNSVYQGAAAEGAMVKVVADDRSNSVLLSGEQSQRLRLRALIAHLDTPLESVGDTSIVDLAAAIQNPANASSALLQGTTIGIGRIAGTGVNFAATLRALRGDTNTNVLSTPSAVTMDNQEAELKVAQEVPFITGQFTNTAATTGGVTGGINPFQTIQRQEVGTILKVTPTISAEGTSLMLKISIESSSIGQKPAGAVDLVTNKRTIATTVLIEDGGVVVLGGLIEDNSVKGEQRVPYLGNIPLLGLLFKTRNATSTKNNLIMFIRPQILRDAAQAAFETDLKYNYMQDQQKSLNRREALPLLPGVSRGKLDAPPPPPPPAPEKPAPPSGSATPSPSAPAPLVQEPAAAPPDTGAPAAPPAAPQGKP